VLIYKDSEGNKQEQYFYATANIVGSLVASGICIISIFNYNTNDK